MLMPKAMVVETYPGRAVIMTEECEFKEIKTTRPLQVGEEIEYNRSDIFVNRRATIALAWAASFILFFLLIYSVTGRLMTGRLYACIGLDINPSLELSVDRGLQVVEARSFNQDGDRIIAAVKPKGQELGTVLAAVVRQSKTAGYLRQSGNVIGIGLSMYSEPEKSAELLARIDRDLEQELAANRSQAKIYYFTIDKKTREQAIKEKVSPVRYLLRQKAREQGLSLQQKDVSLHNPSVERIARKTATKIRVQEQDSSVRVKKGKQNHTTQKKPLTRGEQPLILKKESLEKSEGLRRNAIENFTKRPSQNMEPGRPRLIKKNAQD